MQNMHDFSREYALHLGGRGDGQCCCPCEYFISIYFGHGRWILCLVTIILILGRRAGGGGGEGEKQGNGIIARIWIMRSSTPQEEVKAHTERELPGIREHIIDRISGN